MEDLLRTELSELLLRSARDPRFADVRIAQVDVSPDLGHALVRVSVLADESRRAEIEAALQRAAGYFRNRLAQRLRHMRRVPDLRFRIDRGAEHSQRITDLLENL